MHIAMVERCVLDTPSIKAGKPALHCDAESVSTLSACIYFFAILKILGRLPGILVFCSAVVYKLPYK